MSATADLTREDVFNHIHSRDDGDELRALILDAERALVRERCAKHPAALLEHVACIDTQSGEDFRFHLNPEGESGWEWQRDLLDWWIGTDKTVVLKARQLGITWLAAGYALWHLLYRPGTRVLAVSINETEAAKLVRRVWVQYLSLPVWLRNGVTVVKPARGAEPSTLIELRHPDGRPSAVIGLPSTPKAGHGETAALVILDEFARQDYARETWKAALPTASAGGRIIVISTGNGISTNEGEGNYFHHLYDNQAALGLKTRFLKWDLHPDRDQAWYDREAMALPAADRGEQYPRDEYEAFILTGAPYFDVEALAWYRENAVKDPIERFSFEEAGGKKAKRAVSDQGLIHLYEAPKADRTYAIAADTATGRGQDYSAAYVVDLAHMTIAAEVHGKIPEDQYALQLHYLGRYYQTARIALESAGGFGEATTILLRDGKDGRPPYPNLYRHRQFNRGDLPEHKPYGFPMTAHSRPLAISGLARALRERSLPYVTEGLLKELHTFVHRPTGTSPRAQDGCQDDRVMALAIGLELYRQFGHHPEQRKPKPTRGYQKRYPWERSNVAA